MITGSRGLSILYNFLEKFKADANYTILLPSNICHDVFFLIQYLKMPYIFIDINIRDYCINQEMTIKHLKKCKKSILIFNHSYGIPTVPYAFFLEIRNISPTVVIIDDRCLCTPTMETNIDDNCIDLILYSTGYGKQVDLAGWGFGFVGDSFCMNMLQVTFKKHKYLELKNSFYKNFLNYLPDNDSELDCIHVSNNIDDIEPNYYERLIALEVEKWRIHKSTIIDIYKSTLPIEIQLISEMNNWRFNIIVNKKDAILTELFRNNLFASNHYASIGTMQHKHDCRVADQLHQSIINLFIDKYYTQEKAEKTVSIIRKYLT
ncbi:MAG: hypothetical protein GZ094_13245 [Mariniphaga sp.]|nr:hypothetical protein [Mariniphaga sp.]